MSFLQILLLIIHSYPLLTIESEMRKIKESDLPDKNNSGVLGIPSCDVTQNMCDINCCMDKDCTSWERKSFDCQQHEFEEDLTELSKEECDQRNSDPILCLHHSNSPYLGRFFPDHNSKDNFIKYFSTKRKFEPHVGLKNKGWPVNQQGPSAYKIPSNAIWRSGFCVMRPIKDLKDTGSNCLYTISEETCLENRMLDLNFIASAALLENGNNKTTVEITCSKDGFNYVVMLRNILEGESTGDFLGGSMRKCEDRKSPFLNRRRSVCENVVVSLDYTFKDSKLKVMAHLADVPVSLESLAKQLGLTLGRFDERRRPQIYVSQKVTVQFKNLTLPKTKGYKINQSLRNI